MTTADGPVVLRPIADDRPPAPVPPMTGRAGPDGRSFARQIASEAIGNDDPLGWFERLYASAARGDTVIPWADHRPNPHLLSWAAAHGLAGRRQRALVVGCGLGDDAEALAALGFAVVSFDIAPGAVRMCEARFQYS